MIDVFIDIQSHSWYNLCCERNLCCNYFLLTLIIFTFFLHYELISSVVCQKKSCFVHFKRQIINHMWDLISFVIQNTTKFTQRKLLCEIFRVSFVYSFIKRNKIMATPLMAGNWHECRFVALTQLNNTVNV